MTNHEQNLTEERVSKNKEAPMCKCGKKQIWNDEWYECPELCNVIKREFSY